MEHPGTFRWWWRRPQQPLYLSAPSTVATSWCSNSSKDGHGQFLRSKFLGLWFLSGRWQQEETALFRSLERHLPDPNFCICYQVEHYLNITVVLTCPTKTALFRCSLRVMNWNMTYKSITYSVGTHIQVRTNYSNDQTSSHQTWRPPLWFGHRLKVNRPIHHGDPRGGGRQSSIQVVLPHQLHSRFPN